MDNLDLCIALQSTPPVSEEHDNVRRLVDILGDLIARTNGSADLARHLVAAHGTPGEALQVLHALDDYLDKVISSWALEVRHLESLATKA